MTYPLINEANELLKEGFFTKPGEPWRVYTETPGGLTPYRFVVIFARYQEKWLYTRHKERTTWETAGGHIEPGETPYEAAKRKLAEPFSSVFILSII